MENGYDQIRALALEIVGKSALPRFYEEHAIACQISSLFFDSNPVILELKSFVEKTIDNDFGHGLKHSIKVALDAGALIVVESAHAGYSEIKRDRMLLLVQCAGLLHDIKRKQKNHAVRSAEYAYDVLKRLPLSDQEVGEICLAIKSHEAFKDIIGEFTDEGQLISDCLYDADKFRWGPDNFAHTVWEMVAFSNVPLASFMKHFPRGLSFIKKIKATFRSDTGKKFGPEFINIGISIGNELYKTALAQSGPDRA